MNKIILIIITIIAIFGICLGSYVIGFNQGVNKYYKSYAPLYGHEGKIIYEAYHPPVYPDEPFLTSFVTDWEFVKTFWHNESIETLFSVAETNNISKEEKPFFGSDGKLEGYVKNISYSVVSGKLYNVTFTDLIFRNESDNHPLMNITHKLCLFSYDVNIRDLPNYQEHRVYYTDLGKGVYLIEGVYEI
jgi:hypothetical protein